MFSYFNFNKNQMMLGLAFNIIHYSINCIDKGIRKRKVELCSTLSSGEMMQHQVCYNRPIIKVVQYVTTNWTGYYYAEQKHYLEFVFSTFCHFVPFKMFNHSSALGMQIRFAILSIDLQTWTKKELEKKYKIAHILTTAKVQNNLFLILICLWKAWDLGIERHYIINVNPSLAFIVYLKF